MTLSARRTTPVEARNARQEELERTGETPSLRASDRTESEASALTSGRLPRRTILEDYLQHLEDEWLSAHKDAEYRAHKRGSLEAHQRRVARVWGFTMRLAREAKVVTAHPVAFHARNLVEIETE